MAHVMLLALRREQNRLRRRQLRIERRRLRDYMNPYELDEETFMETFRLNKEAVRAYMNDIIPSMRETVRTTGIPAEIRIFCALNFFASGSYQKVIGQSFVTNMSQTMVSVFINEVTTSSLEVVDRWIQFPRSVEEKNSIKDRFNMKFRVPNILGAVDGTHVAIVKPPSANERRNRGYAPRARLYREEDYVNRKGYHSLNVQILCDADMRILSMNASFPGRSHDAYVWANSRISEHLRGMYENGEESYILGDSGYPLLPWLLVPVVNPAENSAEERFNWAHIRARCTVERCIGLLKGRFRCLLRHRTLHYEPDRSCKIIITCAVLHNIALHFNSNIDRLRVDDIDDDHVPQQRAGGGNRRLEGQRIRNQYIATNFN